MICRRLASSLFALKREKILSNSSHPTVGIWAVLLISPAIIVRSQAIEDWPSQFEACMASLAATLAETLQAELEIDNAKVATTVKQVLGSSDATSSPYSQALKGSTDANIPPSNHHPSPSDANVTECLGKKPWAQLFMLDEQKYSLDFHEPTIINGKRIVKPPKEVFDEGTNRWRNALVGQIIGKPINLNRISSLVNYLWG